MTPESSLGWKVSGERLELSAAGAWTAVQAEELERLADRLASQDFTAKSVVIDMHAVSEFDTFGAWVLERIIRANAKHGREAEVTGLAERYRGLTDDMHHVNLRPAAEHKEHNGLLPAFETLGRAIEAVLRDLAVLLEMFGEVGSALMRVILHPSRIRLTSIVYQLDRVGLQAVPIIALITFLIGAIIAQQGIFHFRKFGAEDYVVDLVGILLLRELGVLIVAIMVAGRSGSSYTAELGSMKMREEIDALRTMGLDPVEVLILPRIIALVCALPILTFLGSLSALYGGGVMAWFYGGMSPAIFIERLKEAISVTHFEVGMYKSPFMALVIGIVACCEGLQVMGSAESLGLRTTSSVVKSIFLVIVLDGFFAIFFASIGM